MSHMEANRNRHVKGTTFVDLVKVLRTHRKTNPLPAMSPAAEALLETRILMSAWYPFEPFVELLKIADELFLKGSEYYAMEMGAAGGVNQLEHVLKAYVNSGDPKGSVMAMRHAWRTHVDFANLTAEIEDDHTVCFTLEGYKDMKMVHAMMIAGWGVAAARVAGASEASAEVLERTWEGAPRFRYRIHF